MNPDKMMHKVPVNIIYIFLPILIGSIFFVDSFLFVLHSELPFIVLPLQNLKEGLIVLLVLCWFLVLKKKILLEPLELKEKLWRFIVFLSLNFLVYIILKYFLLPGFHREKFWISVNLDGLILSNIMGVLAILTLLPILFILRELIFYKQKRTTHLYFNLYLVLLITSAG